MKLDPQAALEQCDTLMLDMDGTILDLAFDNYIWMDLVPRRYAAANGMSFADAYEFLSGKFLAMQGSLDWYCLDHWNERLGLDVLQIHHDVTHKIGYLPGALDFLKTVREHDKRILLVTNSHQDTLDLKDAVTGLTDYFDGIHISHSYGHAKESQAFWEALQKDCDFDPLKTLFVDDSLPVLQSAHDYGVEMLVTVTRPDSGAPVKTGAAFKGVEGLKDLL